LLSFFLFDFLMIVTQSVPMSTKDSRLASWRQWCSSSWSIKSFVACEALEDCRVIGVSCQCVTKKP
jgi:hypothetical protein